PLVDLAGAVLAADGLPDAGPVVEVVGDDRAVPLGGDHRLLDDLRGGVRQPGEDASGVEPADALPAEEVVPVDVPGGELAGGGVTAVGDPERAAHPRSRVR